MSPGLIRSRLKNLLLSRSDTLICNVIALHVSGLVVDQDALVKALQTGTIRAAALDVTHPEPLPRSHHTLLNQV